MITATANTDATVTVTLTGVPEGTTVTRDTGNGPEPVRGMVGLAAGDHLLTDRECPFGILALYAAGDDTAVVTLVSAYPVLSHPLLPLVIPVTIENDSPVDWETPGTVHVPVDAGDVTATFVPRRVVQGNLRVPIADRDVASASQIFADGSPLLLRTPPGCPVGDRWIWAGTVTRERPVADGDLSWVDVPYTRVAAPAVPETPTPVWDWDAVPLAYARWDTITDVSWLDLLAGPGPNAVARWVW